MEYMAALHVARSAPLLNVLCRTNATSTGDTAHLATLSAMVEAPVHVGLAPLCATYMQVISALHAQCQ